MVVKTSQIEEHFIRPSKQCFLCGEQIVEDEYEDEYVVYWQGLDEFGTSITLHANCAAELAAHLLSDSTKACIKAIEGRFREKLGKINPFVKM